ncbi:MAG: flagellar protein FlaG [Devosiaceae bacterium]
METRVPQGYVPVVAAVEPKVKSGSTATDLPRPKTVEPTTKPSQSGSATLKEQQARREETRLRAEAMRSQSEMDVKTHQATGSLVIQTRDAQDGDVIHQFPNNATLKSRAIARYEAVQGAPTIRRTI